MYKIEISNGIKEKRKGFLFSVDALSSMRVFVLVGIFKRCHWYIGKNTLSLGYLFINFNGIKTLITKGVEK